MKKHVMKKWVKALRSGEYSQGHHQLVDDNNNFCCLGVLCDIAPNYVRGEWEDSNSFYKKWSMYGNVATLPSQIQAWAGMSSFNGYIGDGLSLVDYNDQGSSFAEIADIIEKHWEGL